MRNRIVSLVSFFALLVVATPAAALDYPATVTLNVPVTITNYPVPPAGDAGPVMISCAVGPNSSPLGSSDATSVPAVNTNGKLSYSGTMTLVVKLSKPAHSGDFYQCSLWSGKTTLGFKFSVAPSSVQYLKGTLP